MRYLKDFPRSFGTFADPHPAPCRQRDQQFSLFHLFSTICRRSFEELPSEKSVLDVVEYLRVGPPGRAISIAGTDLQRLFLVYASGLVSLAFIGCPHSSSGRSADVSLRLAVNFLDPISGG